MPSHSGFAFDHDSVQRIASVVRAYESGELGDQAPEGVLGKINRPGFGVLIAKVTSATGTAGDYNGDEWFNVDGSWVQGPAVIIRDLNGKSLVVGDYYLCRMIGVKASSGVHYPLLATSFNSLATVSQTVVTAVSCSGSSLTVTTKSLTIPGGVVT